MTAPRPAKLGMKTRLIIPTVSDLAEVQSLQRTGQDEPNTIALQDFTKLAVSQEYDTFVRRPSGAIEQDFGHANWFMLISSRIDSGKSWHLGTYLAHAFEARGALWMGAPQAGDVARQEQIVVATGAIQKTGMVVQKVGQIPEKLALAQARLLGARSVGLRAVFLLPEANLADIPPDMDASCRHAGIEIHGVATVAQALEILGLEAAAASATAWQGSPWPGLASYTNGQRRVFFGRDRDRQAALERMLEAEARSVHGVRRAFLLVHGPSGVGKSSFVKAGLVGDIIELVPVGAGWQDLVLTFSGENDRPDIHIAQSILSALNPAPGKLVPSFAELVEKPDRIVDVLDAAGRGRLLLVLDQFEQALAGQASENAQRLGTFLDGLCASSRVWIIVTIRSGQLELLYRIPSLSGLAADARQFRLTEPSIEALARIITGPAEAAGITFSPWPDGTSLVQALVDEASLSPDSLPLLQLSLSRLYGYATNGVIGPAAYDRMGGLAGVVATSADEAVAKLEAEGITEATIDRLLLELVRIDPETGDVLARAIPAPVEDRSSGSADPVRSRILRHLTDTRLLVSLDDGEGQKFRLAHEALIQHWPRLGQIVGKKRDEIHLRDEIEAEARSWDRAGRGAERLRQVAERVARADDLREAGHLPLSLVAIDYTHASAKALVRERRNQFLIWRVLPLAITVVSAVVAISLLLLSQKAQTAEKAALDSAQAASTASEMAEDRLALAQATESLWFTSVARGESAEGRNVTALSRLLDALPLDLVTPDRPLVPEAFAEFQRLSHRDLTAVRLNEAHGSIISSIAWSRDGARVVTASFDNSIKVWNRATGLELLRITGHDGFVNSVDISPDGHRIVSSSDDRTLRLWDSETGAEVRILAKADAVSGWMTDAQYALNGERILAHDHSGSVYLFNAKNLDLIRKSPGVPYVPITPAVSGDGSLFMTEAEGGWLRTYRTVDGKETSDMFHPMDGIVTVIFLQGNAHVAIGYRDGTIRLWDIASKAMLREMKGHRELVTRLVQSPDGSQLISASHDGPALLWDLTAISAPVRLMGQEGRMDETDFIGDGDMVATASFDGLVRLWESRSGSLIAAVEADDFVPSILKAEPGGSGFAVGSTDGTLWIGDTVRRSLPQPLEQFGKPDLVLGPAPEGDRVYAAEIDPSGNTTKSAIWSTTTRLRTDLQSPTADDDMLTASFQAAGDVFATVGITGDALLWRQSDGAFLRKLSGSWRDSFVPVFSPDGRTVLSSDEGAVQIAQVEKDVVPVETLSLDGPVTAGAWSDDGSKLVTGTGIGRLSVWDRKANSWVATSTTRIEKKGSFSMIVDVALTQDGSTVLALTDDNEVWLWNPTNQVTNATWRWLVGPGSGSKPTRFGLEETVRGLALSPDGSQVALGLERDVVILDLLSGAELRRLVGHEDGVRRLGFSAGSDYLITAAFDGTARIWDIKTGLPIYVLGTPGQGRAASFGISKDGVTLVSGDGMIVRLSYGDLINPATWLEYQRLLFAKWGAAAGAVAAPSSTDNGEVSDCDRLTAHPFDRQARAKGIRFDQLDDAEAVKACQRALTDDPENPRYLYQLGRGHSANGDATAAQDAFRSASAAGYGMAYYALAAAEPDTIQKTVLLESAVARGAFVASGDLGELLWHGPVQPEGRSRAKAVWEAGIVGGDPYSAAQLGRVAALGLDGQRDPESALGYFLLAARLWQRAGYDGKADLESAANLARSLPPEAAVRIAREIAAKP